MSRSKFDSGSLPSQKLSNLSACHPFVQQECEEIRPRIAARADLGCRSPLGRYRVSYFHKARRSSHRTRHDIRMRKVETRAFCSARPGRDQRAGVQKVRIPQTRHSSFIAIRKRRVSLLLQQCDRLWVQPPWDRRDVVYRHSRCPHSVN